MLTNKQRESIGLKYILDKLTCHSPYGIELVRRFVSGHGTYKKTVNDLNIEFDNIEKAKALTSRQTTLLCNCLAHLINIRGTVNKCENLTLSEVELFELKGFLLTYLKFRNILKEVKFSPEGIQFPSLIGALDVLDPTRRRIAPFSIENDFSVNLSQIRHQKALIETLISSEGMTEELLLERAEIVAREDSEEARVMETLTQDLRRFVNILRDVMDSIGKVDLIMAKAQLTKHYNAVRPTITQTNIKLTDMLNPYMEDALTKTGGNFKSISICLQKGATVITGANMGGKSVAIKTVMLNTILCQMGFFVFAKKAEIPIIDDIILIAEESQSNYISSFGNEMKAINELIPIIKKGFMFIALDEPARSTNPVEGWAIVRALVAYLAESESISVIATHYDKVTPPGAAHYQTAGLHADASEKLKKGWSESLVRDLIDYSLIKVDSLTPVPKDALNICKMIGLNSMLLKKIEHFLESSSDTKLHSRYEGE